MTGRARGIWWSHVNWFAAGAMALLLAWVAFCTWAMLMALAWVFA
jgi:hypothetical protein